MTNIPIHEAGDPSWKQWIGYFMPLLIGLSSGAFSGYVSVQILAARVAILETDRSDHEARMRLMEVAIARSPANEEAVRIRQDTVLANQQLLLQKVAIMAEQLQNHSAEMRSSNEGKGATFNQRNR